MKVLSSSSCFLFFIPSLSSSILHVAVGGFTLGSILDSREGVVGRGHRRVPFSPAPLYSLLGEPKEGFNL